MVERKHPPLEVGILLALVSPCPAAQVGEPPALQLAAFHLFIGRVADLVEGLQMTLCHLVNVLAIVGKGNS